MNPTLLPIAVVGAGWAAEPAPADDFRSYVDQARFFVKREWYADAAEQLELAVRTDDGRLDPEAWFLLAKVRYELADLEGARSAADRALVNSRTPEQTAQANELLRWLTDQFGYVHLVAQRPGVATRVDIRLDSVIFDPQLKLYFNKLTARLDGPLTLPYTLGLPTGAYTINGEPVEVVAGEESSLAPRIRGGAIGLQVVELELGAGLSGWVGPSTRNLLPAPTFGVALSLPVQSFVIGVLGDWSAQPFQTATGPIFVDATSWSVGARAGVEVPGTEPLVLRPSLGWRYARVGGLELACTDAGATFACAPGATPHQLFVHAAGTAHVPFVELAALYLDRTRRSGFGGGVKISGDYALGRLPQEGTATSATGETFAWTAEGAWRAVGLRVLADLSYAF